MRALEYAVRQALASLWRGRVSSALAVVAIALAMLVLGALLLVTWNVQRVVERWTAVAEFSVYLADDATSEQRGTIETAIDRSGVAVSRQYVSKTEALGRFRQEFADLEPLTADLSENPFPASIEVRLQVEAQQDGRAEALVRRVAEMPGVADVRYDREWLARVAAGLQAVRNAGFSLVAIMALAAGVTVAAVVRLGLHARSDEIEIMKLVGSPLAFIRGPFVAEGLIQGGCGALLALVLLWLGFTVVAAGWGGELSTALDGAVLEFLPARLWALLLAGGMAVGGGGGFAASRNAV
jgi:cell division transport system permease protein